MFATRSFVRKSTVSIHEKHLSLSELAQNHKFNPQDYHVSFEIGFLLKNPLHKLPKYYEAWNNLAKKLAKHLKKGDFREQVEKLPELDTKLLTSYRQKRCAHLMLCCFTACYVHDCSAQRSADVLPKNVAVPLYELCMEF